MARRLLQAPTRLTQIPMAMVSTMAWKQKLVPIRWKPTRTEMVKQILLRWIAAPILWKLPMVGGVAAA